jgi:hypothetical protein
MPRSKSDWNKKRRERQRLNRELTKGVPLVVIDAEGTELARRMVATSITQATEQTPGSTITPPRTVNANPDRNKKPRD